MRSDFQMSAMPRWTGWAFLAANALGAVVYVARASDGWRIAAEHGVIPVTGEPLVWFAGILPVIVVCVLINLVWAAMIVRYRQSRSCLWWLPAAAIWIVAVAIDFVHH
jgi:hypothetical protein